MTTFVIARLTFREAARRRILLAALILGLAFLAIYGIGFHYINAEIVRSNMSSPTRAALRNNEMRNFLLMAGLYVVNFLTIMMAVLTSVDTLSGEIASGTIHTLVSKPVQRWEIVLGKWLGYAGMITLYLIMMAGGVILLVYLVGGYATQNILPGISLMWLNAILLLGVSLLGGATLSTLANGVMVFGLYGIAFVGGWIEQIGALLQSQTAINIGVISSLIIPSEALWRRAAYEMQSPLVQALGFSPFTSSSMPSSLMVWYAVLYTLAALIFAIRQFRKRDL